MSKNSHKALASATVMSLVLTSTLAATNVQAAAEVTRMPGADRYTTAQTVAKKSFGKAENVVLVNGLGYADSVSATPFAKLKNAPILLTDAEDKPSADLLATLTELGAKNIYIVGGKGVVTEAMEKELAKNYTVERIGGTSRYETNAEIAKKVIAETKAEKAILVNGQDGYADALSVASIAATKGYPVIFGNKNNVPTVVKDAVKDVKEILAVGGEGVLPDAVIKAVEAKRIAKGADRFDTNLKVLEHFDGDFNFENIFVAAGGDDSTSKFADALVASAAAAKHGAPVVLTGLGANKDNVDKSVKYVKDKMGDDTKVTIVGGTASVSEAIEKDIKGEKETGRNEVQSIEALNLNQVKIVFADKVDEDAAEDVTNYEIDGDTLTEYKEGESHKDTDAIAVLQDDERTVILTIANEQEQHDEVTVKVKKGVLSLDKTKNMKEYEKDVVFKDLVAPKVSKVTARGNSKLVVEFSEAVFVKDADDEKDAAKLLAEKFEIDGQSIDSMGLDGDYSKAKDTLITEDGAYVNKVEFYFSSALDSGKNEFKVLDGTKDEILCDAAGFIVKEAKFDVSIDDVTSKPKVKSVKGGTDGKIYINFDRAMDTETAQKLSNYELNNEELSEKKAELKKDDTQVKITVDSGLIKTGSNVIEISDKVKDAFGNKVDDDTRISFTAEKDETKPKVAAVTSIDAETIRVRFTEDVRYNHATNRSNYELKDSTGTDITSDIDEIKAANGTTDDTDVYDIKMLKDYKLSGSKYTLKIENIADTSDNVMDDYTATINGEDDEAPEVDGVRRNGEKIIIKFSEEMDRASLRKAENYRYIDEDGKVKDLPSKTTINVASDNKTVTLEFPDAYSKDAKITGIVVKSSVKDLAGNQMEADHTNKSMNDSFDIEVKEKSMKVKRNGDDVEVEIVFDAAVDKVKDKTKFKFGKEGSENITPDSVRTNGSIITFKFNDGEKADAVRACGADLAVTFEDGAAVDKSEQPVKGATLKVWDNYVAPELDVDEKNGYVDNWGFNVKENTVTIKFDAQVDESLASAYKDDFDFISDNGNKLDVDSVKIINDTYLEFKFEKANVLEGTKNVTVRANKNKIDVRTKKDGAGNYKEYKPEDKDISGRKTKNADFKVEDKEEKDLEAAKKAYNEALTAAKEANVDVKQHEVADVEKATKAELEAATTKINNAVKEAKEVAEANAKIAEALKKVTDVELDKDTEVTAEAIIAKLPAVDGISYEATKEDGKEEWTISVQDTAQTKDIKVTVKADEEP